MMRAAWRVSLATLAAVLPAGCADSVPEGVQVRPVRAIKVGDMRALEGREFPGRAQAKNEVDLSFQVSGPLITLAVDVGSEIKSGDLIAAIDPRDFQASFDVAQGNLDRARANLLAMERGARPEELEQLKAALEEAEASYRQAFAEHERNAKLLPTRAVSQSDFDLSLARQERTAAQVKTAKENLNIGMSGARVEDIDAKRAEIKALEAAVANAKNQLDYAVLTAPFDGVVAARFVDNFQTVQAKQPIVRLLDVSSVEVTIQVPESLISLAPQVKSAVCRFDAFPDREFIGQVTKIGSEASQTTRTFPVTVQVEQPDDVQILPGMAATVRNHPSGDETSADQDLIVPLSAVFTTAGGPQRFVWVFDEANKKAVRRAVTAGALTPAGLAIVDGLSAGEWVVTAGVNSLADNQPIKLFDERGE